MSRYPRDCELKESRRSGSESMSLRKNGCAFVPVVGLHPPQTIVRRWCRWSDSNRHDFLRSQDFKSCASAISPHRHSAKGSEISVLPPRHGPLDGSASRRDARRPPLSQRLHREASIAFLSTVLITPALRTIFFGFRYSFSRFKLRS